MFMIILGIPKRINGKSLEDFIYLQVKKLKRNRSHKYIQLQGEVTYSREHVYFIFPNRALELAFTLSLLFKCQKHDIPCVLEISKPVDLKEIPGDVLEAAKIWSERKLPRRFYRLRDLRL